MSNLDGWRTCLSLAQPVLNVRRDAQVYADPLLLAGIHFQVRGGDGRPLRDGDVREAQAGVTAGRGGGVAQPDGRGGGVQRTAVLVGVVGRGGDLRGERRRAAARRRRGRRGCGRRGGG